MALWMIYALASAFFTALATIFLKVSLKSADPILTATVQSTIANLFLIIAFFSSRGFINGLKVDYSSMSFITLSGIAGGLSWIFYLFGLKHGAVTQVASLERVNIVFIVIMCTLFLGECWHFKYVIGAGLIALGAALITL